MPRIRKTSTQPKRKAKPAPVIARPVYPDYIENFIKLIGIKIYQILRTQTVQVMIILENIYGKNVMLIIIQVLIQQKVIG